MLRFSLDRDIVEVGWSPAERLAALRVLLQPAELTEVAQQLQQLARRSTIIGQIRARFRVDPRLFTLKAMDQLDLQYIPDPRGRDIWKSAIRTWLDGGGDCEDLAIFKASIALALDMSVMLVVGTFRGQGHMWFRVFDQNEREWGFEPTNDKAPPWSATIRRTSGQDPDPPEYKTRQEFFFSPR